MASAARVPVAQYLATSYRPDREYLDGAVLDRNAGEWDHSRLQAMVIRQLLMLEDRLGILVVPEQRVQVRPNRFRVPDVCVVTERPRGPILTEPPLLCIEILSREDRMPEMQERLSDYIEFGVPHVWVINPRTRRGYVFDRSGMREVVDGVLSTSHPAIEIQLSDVFEG